MQRRPAGYTNATTPGRCSIPVVVRTIQTVTQNHKSRITPPRQSNRVTEPSFCTNPLLKLFSRANNQVMFS